MELVSHNWEEKDSVAVEVFDRSSSVNFVPTSAKGTCHIQAAVIVRCHSVMIGFSTCALK